MGKIYGTLSIIESQKTSFLEPGNNWLLLDEPPDPAQAGRAATELILNVKHLSNGAQVAVIGTRNTIGTQPVIVMEDINAAGILRERAVPAMKKRKAPGHKPKNLRSKLHARERKGRGKRSGKKPK